MHTAAHAPDTRHVLQHALQLTRRRWRLIVWSAIELACLASVPVLLVLAIVTGLAHALPAGAAVTPPSLGGWLLALGRILQAVEQGTLGPPLIGLLMVSASLLVALVAFFEAGLYGALADDLAGDPQPSFVARARHHFARMLGYTLTRLALVSACGLFALTVLATPLAQETTLSFGQRLWTALGMSGVALAWLLCTLWRMNALGDVVFADATAGQALTRAWSRLAARLGDLLRLTGALAVLLSPLAMAVIVVALLGLWLDQQPALQGVAIAVHLIVDLLVIGGLATAQVLVGAAFLVEHRRHLGPLDQPLAKPPIPHRMEIMLGHAVLPADSDEGLALTLMPHVKATPNMFKLSEHLGERRVPTTPGDVDASVVTPAEVDTDAVDGAEVIAAADVLVDDVLLETTHHPLEDDGFDGWLAAAATLDVLEEISITVDETEAPAEEVALLDVDAGDEDTTKE